MLKRCLCILTMTTLKKLETYYPMHCFSSNTHTYPQKAKHFWIFFSTSEGRVAKNKCSVEKQKAVIHMQLAQLNLLLKPLLLQLSLTPAQQGQWNMTSILSPSTAAFSLTHEIGDSYSSWAAALMQSAQNQPCTLFKPPFVTDKTSGGSQGFSHSAKSTTQKSISTLHLSFYSQIQFTVTDKQNKTENWYLKS